MLAPGALGVGVLLYESDAAETNSKSAELKSYKAEVRAKVIAVGKAEIILNEVCLSTARRVGLAEGTRISDNKGGILLEVGVGVTLSACCLFPD